MGIFKHVVPVSLLKRLARLVDSCPFGNESFWDGAFSLLLLVLYTFASFETRGERKMCQWTRGQIEEAQFCHPGIQF